MVLKLDFQTSNFEEQFAAFLTTKREVSEDVIVDVDRIISAVQANGDETLHDLTLKFDQVDTRKIGLKITSDELDQALGAISDDVRAALELAHERITSHHARQMPNDDFYKDHLGVELGSRWTAIDAVGLYVPGGTASYPSSVLMNAIPAKVAGVQRIAMVVPAAKGKHNPAILAAARIAGVSEIYRIGGAHGVAALAYGTETIKPVAKIVGPGNAWVAAAKRQVFGTVGIDMIAGPSEVLIIADKNNNPDWIAADLLAQAEHDVGAQAILITDDADLADQVVKAVSYQIKQLPRGEIAAQSWNDFGAIIMVPNLEEAFPLANRIAAEHLELALDNADDYVSKVRNAGSIFVGHYTPEAIGDYVAGSNHVLPTARSARYSSGLSVYDFIKRTSVLKLGPEQLAAIGPAAMTLAETEGLSAHARSISIRTNAKG
ncbi:histidinol dehydrogenase [Lentilitoribacter sp. Alg239-R112]|uniref:histidinol dehydrogenase n=1 Tax=Lentilitoribacter sp. Alg239-R112 TaxID=2305987 RepID=UPI0013A69E01|nr:histidinol dehydrogenase [Lentilitoribacter sp. Alg239-R112]